MVRVVPTAISSKNRYRWKRPEPVAAQFRQLVVAQAKLSQSPPVLLGVKVQGGEQVGKRVQSRGHRAAEKSEGRWASQLWRERSSSSRSSGPPESH